jgi:hypothetical protein
VDEGIRIEDVACEISPQGLEALLARRGGEVKVTRLDCAVSPAALNALLQRFAPPGEGSPRAQVSDGSLTVENVGPEGAMKLELRAGGFRLEITSAGLRLRTEPAE